MVAYIDSGSNYYVFIMIIVLVGIQLLSNWNYLSTRFTNELEHSINSRSMVCWVPIGDIVVFPLVKSCFVLHQEINAGYIQINLASLGRVSVSIYTENAHSPMELYFCMFLNILVHSALLFMFLLGRRFEIRRWQSFIVCARQSCWMLAREWTFIWIYTLRRIPSFP